MKTYMRPRVCKPRVVKIREYKTKPIIALRKSGEFDFLKYIKVVRAWARFKHDMSIEDFEMLCFLYSENIFTIKKFDEYNQVFGFSQDRRRDMASRGFISTFRAARPGQQALYEVSMKGKAIMRSIYKKLLGEEPITELVTPDQLRVRNNSAFAHRQYTRVIRRMNNDFKARPQRPEL